jgi:tRNA(fMet)-specific endonuclease VapC
MSFLLDTDTCSAHLKQRGNLTHKFLQYMGRLHVSVITLGELFTWALRAKAPPQRLQSLLDLLNDVQL